MANARPDFVQVRLTLVAIEMAKDHPVTVSNGRRSFLFSADTPQEVERSYEWNAFLSKLTLPGGAPLVELVPTDASTPSSVATVIQPPQPAPTPKV